MCAGVRRVLKSWTRQRELTPCARRESSFSGRASRPSGFGIDLSECSPSWFFRVLPLIHPYPKKESYGRCGGLSRDRDPGPCGRVAQDLRTVQVIDAEGTLAEKSPGEQRRPRAPGARNGAAMWGVGTGVRTRVEERGI